MQEVTDEIIENISAAYAENPPDFIYFVTLYNIFNEFLEDISEDVLPNEATGFKQSKIWGMLYNFQRDAVLAIINKLEKYNGCILADSVGLGKTFTAVSYTHLDVYKRQVSAHVLRKNAGPEHADLWPGWRDYTVCGN